MVIEVNGGGKHAFRTYYASSLRVTLNEKYGILSVTDKKGISQPKVYVKVFYEKKGAVNNDNAIFF